PWSIAFWVHWPSCASLGGLLASACRVSFRVGESPVPLTRSPPFRRALISALLMADASSAAWQPGRVGWDLCVCRSFEPDCRVVDHVERPVSGRDDRGVVDNRGSLDSNEWAVTLARNRSG